MSVKCAFTSEWDDGSVITTPCRYHTRTGLVEPAISNGAMHGTLINTNPSSRSDQQTGS